MSAVCEIAPQNGVGEHESPLSSPDCEQPKGKVIPSDDSGIGMDDSHVFSMDQSATSDDLNATTPESEIAEDTIVPQKKQETEQTNSLLESFPKKSENGTEAADDSEISQNSQPQEETRTQVTEEVSAQSTQLTESMPNGDIKTVVLNTETKVTVTSEVTESEEPAVEEETIVPKKKEDEPQLSSTGEGETFSDECEVKITVTEAEDVQPTEEEEEEPEPEPEPEPEEPRVDFVRGIKCDDVSTALDILKTRYRLSDVTVKKCIITWSCWNLPDLVIKRPLSDWRESPEKVPDLPENEELQADRMVEHINTKEEEIDKLVKEVLKAEEDKKRQEKPGKLEPVQEEDVIAVESAPAPESAPTGDGEGKKKKRGNIFTRMVHALRKRFGSNNRRSRA